MFLLSVRRFLELGLQDLGRLRQRELKSTQLDRSVDDLGRVAATGLRWPASAGCEQHPVEAVQRHGVDSCERGRADVGDHVVVHVALVRVERRRAHCVLDRRQPLDEIVGQRLPRRVDVLATVELREQVDARTLGLLLRLESGVPLRPALAGQRVRRALDDHAPLVALLRDRASHGYSSGSDSAGSGDGTLLSKSGSFNGTSPWRWAIDCK